MNGNNNVLLDSNILIAISKNEDTLEYYLGKFNKVYISIISYIEVLGFDFKIKKEKETLIEIINSIEIANMNFDIADISIEVREKNKIKLPDAIIYATAVYLNAELITRNTEDFKNLF